MARPNAQAFSLRHNFLKFRIDLRTIGSYNKKRAEPIFPQHTAVLQQGYFLWNGGNTKRATLDTPVQQAILFSERIGSRLPRRLQENTPGSLSGAAGQNNQEGILEWKTTLSKLSNA